MQVLKECKHTDRAKNHCREPLHVRPHKRGYLNVECAAGHQWVWCANCCTCGTNGCNRATHWIERDCYDTGKCNHVQRHSQPMDIPEAIDNPEVRQVSRFRAALDILRVVSSLNFCFDPKATERGTGEGGRSPQRAASNRTAPLELAVQPKSAEERGSEGGERSGREGAGGAGVPSPTSVEHPTAHASTGRGADARDGEASDKARVGRGRHRRNMVAGQVVDPERLVSLVLSMGGARSLTAKRRWRVSLSTPACISASHASDTPAFLASLPFVPSLSFPSPPRLRLPISTYSSCFWMLCL